MESKFRTYTTGLQHIGIPTTDIQKTKEFYGQLGFEPAFEKIDEEHKVSFLKLGDLVLEVYYTDQPALVTGAIDHVSLNVTDIEAVHKLAEEAGYTFVDKEITFLPFWANGVKYFSIEGPNKEKVEFNQYL